MDSDSKWYWQVFCEDTITQEFVEGCFGRGADETYLNWLFSAWGWTVSVSLLSLLLALFVGTLVGIMRTLPSHKWLVRLATAWVELFRNIPLLVQIFIWYHVVPGLIPVMKSLPGLVLVVFALGFFTSARVAEQVRAGVQTLPKGQRYAAMALGFETWQTYLYVLLPMAFRIIIPPLTSEAMNVFKNSAVAFAVSISELTMYAMQTQEETNRTVEVYLAVTLLYVISAFAVNRVMRAIEVWTQVPGFNTSGAKGGH